MQIRRILANVRDSANVRRVLDALAAVSASEFNGQALSRRLGIANNTVRSHADLLETLFLVRRVPAWSGNLLTRVIRAPKTYVSDAGLLADLVGADADRIITDLPLGGMLFETFATMELLRQSEVAQELTRLAHYRDKEGREVDVVLERRDGSVVGVEVKAAASATPSDFRGLRYLRDRLGERFKAGVLLYTGEGTVPFGDRLAAVPLGALWMTGA